MADETKDSDRGPYDIKIKTVAGEEWTFSGYDKIKISKIKLLLCDLLNLEDAQAPSLQISHKQQILEDDKRLGDYNLNSGDFLALFIKEMQPRPAGNTPVVDATCEWCQQGDQLPTSHPRCPWCNPAVQMPPGGNFIQAKAGNFMHPPHHRPHHPHHFRHGPGHPGRCGHRGRGRGWWRHHLLHFHGMPPPAQQQ